MVGISSLNTIRKIMRVILEITILLYVVDPGLFTLAKAETFSRFIKRGKYLPINLCKLYLTHIKEIGSNDSFRLFV